MGVTGHNGFEELAATAVMYDEYDMRPSLNLAQDKARMNRNQVVSRVRKLQAYI